MKAGIHNILSERFGCMRRANADDDGAMLEQFFKRSHFMKSELCGTFSRCAPSALGNPIHIASAVLCGRRNGDAHFTGMQNSNCSI